jgi:hypothetical protein
MLLVLPFQSVIPVGMVGILLVKAATTESLENKNKIVLLIPYNRNLC